MDSDHIEIINEYLCIDQDTGQLLFRCDSSALHPIADKSKYDASELQCQNR